MQGNLPFVPVRRAAGGGSQSQGGDLLGRQTHFRHASVDSNQPAEEYGAVPDERARNLRWRLGSGDVLRGTDPRMPDGGDRGRCGDAGVLGARHDLTLFTKGHPDEQKLKLDRSGLGLYFAHTAIVKEKDRAAYARLVDERG